MFSLFRLPQVFRAVQTAQQLVETVPVRFARFSSELIERGYPPLVYTDHINGKPVFRWNKDYVLHSWGLVLPNQVQFQIRLHKDGQLIEMHKQYLMSFEEIFLGER
jgi:hypothetical protein